MLTYTPFYINIWSNKKFKLLPNSDCRILFIYLIANHSLTMTGIYNIDIDDCRLKTRLGEKFDECFNEVTGGKYHISYDIAEEMIFIKSRFERIPSRNSPKVITGVIGELNDITHPFKDEFLKIYQAELKPYLWRVNGYKLTSDELQSDDFIYNASKLYNNRRSLKEFLMNKGVGEERIDQTINRILPNWNTDARR